jgi:glutamine cyclotransferase
VGDRVFQLTWLSHIGFIYDLETFEPLDRFHYPTQGWGLTYDGEQLIMSDGTAMLYRLDPESLEQSAAFEVTDGASPVERLNELEYIDGAIWANVWLTDEIVIISAESGRVVGRIDLSDLPVDRPDDPDAVLNGIAYDDASGRIFVTGKRWPQLFEVRLRPPR